MHKLISRWKIIFDNVYREFAFACMIGNLKNHFLDNTLCYTTIANYGSPPPPTPPPTPPPPHLDPDAPATVNNGYVTDLETHCECRGLFSEF